MSGGLRGAATVVGVGEVLHPRGGSPSGERALVLEAILEACADAGISPRELDGFTSYAGGDHSGPVLGAELGIDELRWSSMVWGGGGGGSSAAVVAAAAAIATGQAECVAVVRGMTQADTGRLGYAKYYFDHHYLAHGVATPAQVCALRTQRMLESDGVPRSALRSLVLASYAHAQNVPRAAGYGRPLTAEAYDESPLIVEPFHLFDCSRENDGAAVLILTATERARDLRQPPAVVLAGAQGAPGGYSALSENDEAYATAGFAGLGAGRGVAQRLWQQATMAPSEVEVVQVYENFSGPAVASLIDHGLCPPGPEAGSVLTVENLTVGSGSMPVNTAGGNIADCFVNGMNLAVEAVRQVRGTALNQVRAGGVDTSLSIGGPMAPLVSSVLFGSERAL
ncbi:hypothetical protein K8Z61_12420 [Nocardioides sp. TRM66260-LWL]|uniref:thiolase C-terminal domain-containing protein n=1 Tax=Nocardioides sp. TRM66260-LWL TaxID=2874478 RepID=UPI001CC4A57B|nr:hypothetical protein [Nocardioides sp. TRM66260-LWL]MBZ5735300.1 hypothetical protein [Nocardioides sp. TRM66260-LWL]